MKIGIDVDDVTLDFMPVLLDFYNLNYSGNLELEDIFSFKLWEVGMGRTKEEAVQIVHNFYSSKFYERIPFINGARQGILKSCENHDCCFVSARYSSVRERTSRFLIREFPETQVFYSKSYIDDGKTKAEICLEGRIGVMIEDELNTALECQNAGIRVLLFDKPWNRNANGKLERVHNWKEILEKINEGVKE